MSDEEYEYEEYSGDEEEEDEDVIENKEEDEDEDDRVNREETRSVRSRYSDGEELLRARNEARKAELNDQLKDVINEWRKNRAKEEEELKKLKELQARRKEIRAEQELKLAEKKREEEEKLRREEAEKKAREAEEKRRRLEEAEKKRQMMIQSQRNKMTGDESEESRKTMTFASIQDAKREKVKTKEELLEEKRIALSIRVKPLDITDLGIEGLKSKAGELWENIVRLETEKYDLEERQKRQGYDLQELQTRQTQRLRLKAVRLGLDAEALTGKHPPKIQTASKFERHADNKSYEDKQRLFDGGWEILNCELLERDWKEKVGDWNKQPRNKLPKWGSEKQDEKDSSTPDEDNSEEVNEIQNDIADDGDSIEEEEDEGEEDEEDDDEYEYE